MATFRILTLITSPVQLQQFQNLPAHDAAIRFLASDSHPQQRRKLFRSHKRKLDEFIQDSNLQWDNGYYVTQRFSNHRFPESLYTTPEIQQNIEASKAEDGGNVPLRRNRFGDDKLTINELQMNLSNQAATLRLGMTSEYEDMRSFQNHELEYLLKQKESKEPEFHKLVEDIRKHGIRPSVHRTSSSKPTQRDPPTNPQVIRSPVISQNLTMSPAQIMSPSDGPDINQLKTDPSLSPFVKFFLDMQVVQQNWRAIAPNWLHYVLILNRKLMTEHAFAKAIFEDVVRTTNVTKFPVDTEHVSKTREMAKNLPDTMHISQIITDVILEMAEEGSIEFTMEKVETKSEVFGPKILMDVMSLEAKLQSQAPETLTLNVEKATDPRQKG